ncbi:hypothetical protein BCR32DRAFT_281096 [Anaeromyces robustus]|uniref:Uncharacterized protein n=1 Tax=Anaeromyces robustus TaxID=1754192 RepID=A0A1Y1X285_9FUNG|nr:hypothetical protein BCR32DRAFT_281096 [Anaeromyces robustus]|eukprot:ORX79775.1 hypothetical protein BCR32DRAFT_281096 [Anaeromyces robustus]
MLMAVISRAVCRYDNISKETPFYSVTPCDLRAFHYVTEVFRKRKFYSNVGPFKIHLDLEEIEFIEGEKIEII